MIRKHRLNPHERYERAREKRYVINSFLNRTEIIGKNFFVKFRAGRAASNIQKNVHIKIVRNDPPGRFDASDREQNMGFDDLIIRRKDNIALPFYVDFNMSSCYFNTAYPRKPHSLPKGEVITKNECIPYFNTYFLFFSGLDIYSPERYALIDGRIIWDIGKDYWGKLIWISSEGKKVWSTERNVIRFDIKRILAVEHKHIIWCPILSERKGLGVVKPSLTLLQAVNEAFKKERKTKK